MLSILIPAWNEAENLTSLLPLVHDVAAGLKTDYEILVADADSGDGTDKICREERARYLNVRSEGFGKALRHGFGEARGDYVLTMDADFSHPPQFIRDLWDRRREADLIIASRYAEGGGADMPPSRRFLSWLLNVTFRRALHIPVRDLSSNFRLYRTSLLSDIAPEGSDFNILQEILILSFSQGYRVLEVPFHYGRRDRGSSHARLIAFGVQYLKTFGKMWRLRNSTLSGDYDLRAYDSLIPLQRWWQRKRCRVIVEMTGGRGSVLDVGCGSSRVLEALPPGSVGLDPSMAKLRHARRLCGLLVAGGLPGLPVRSESFDTVICSQVIEHIPDDDAIFGEFHRVLKPGGILVLGTPDYDRLAWRITETLYRYLIPGGYADEHITHYSRNSLGRRLEQGGFKVERHSYIGGGELVIQCRKLSPS